MYTVDTSDTVGARGVPVTTPRDVDAASAGTRTVGDEPVAGRPGC
ncbi:hypothetical protein [Pseudonocardia sp. NPDC049635]